MLIIPVLVLLLPSLIPRMTVVAILVDRAKIENKHGTVTNCVPVVTNLWLLHH